MHKLFGFSEQLAKFCDAVASLSHNKPKESFQYAEPEDKFKAFVSKASLSIINDQSSNSEMTGLRTMLMHGTVGMRHSPRNL